jgi:AraC-like DNA-binding protein
MLDFEKHCKLLRSGHYAGMPQHFMERQDPMDYLLLWVLGGRGFVEVEERLWEGQAGHLFSLRPHQPHSYGSDARRPWDIVWLHFQGDLAEDFVQTIRQYGGVRVDYGLDPELRDRWMELVITHNSDTAGAELRGHTGLAGLLGLILYRLQLQTIVPESQQPLEVAALQRFIHQHYRQPITLDDLAREANLSPTHFARVFKKQFQVSPMYYVIQKRIAVACSLLTESAMPIKEISAAVGYDDPYYFSRLFKKLTGVNPTTYRQRRLRPA